jgi:hypothetical protein
MEEMRTQNHINPRIHYGEKVTSKREIGEEYYD